MKLMRIGDFGAECPIVRIDADTYIDVSDVTADFDEHFFEGSGLEQLREIVATRAQRGEVRHFRGERIGAPVARPHQILCIGLNYRDHAEEAQMKVPDEPIVFHKSPNTLVFTRRIAIGWGRCARHCWSSGTLSSS